MNCRRARTLLTSGRATSGEARSHVEGCVDCGRFARSLAAAERALGEHFVQVSPPAGFVDNVRAQLPRDEELLGWAALRLLPATLCLVLLLSWLNFRGGSAPAAATDENPTDAVLTWVLDPSNDLEDGS